MDNACWFRNATIGVSVVWVCVQQIVNGRKISNGKAKQSETGKRMG